MQRRPTRAGGHTVRIPAIVGLGLVLVIGQGSVSSAAEPAVARALPGDVNGDGYADLLIGVTQQTVGDKYHAGVLQVLYGSPLGITAEGDQVWSPASAGVAGPAGGNSHFGMPVVSADFNSDGYADAAVGARWDATPISPTDTGTVTVLYGSAQGLVATGSKRITAATSGCQAYGASMTAVDADDDGYPDLVIGAYGCPINGLEYAGAIEIHRGSAGGLATDASWTITQATGVVPGDPAAGANFGWPIAGGDFNGDGRDDLVTGGSSADLAGKVIAIMGTPTGIDGSSASVGGIGGIPAPGDFNGDGIDDLALGSPREDVGGISLAGVLRITYGTPSGLDPSTTRAWHQDTPGVPGINEASDRFGNEVAAGDFDGDGYADVAVGALEGVHGYKTAGAVTVLRGSPTGITTTGSSMWTQDTTGIANAAESTDRFGSALSAANFGKSYRSDLAIGVFTENLAGIKNAGMVHVLYGSRTGLSASGSQTWSQASGGVKGTIEAQDWFGESLAP